MLACTRLHRTDLSALPSLPDLLTIPAAHASGRTSRASGVLSPGARVCDFFVGVCVCWCVGCCVVCVRRRLGARVLSAPPLPHTHTDTIGTHSTVHNTTEPGLSSPDGTPGSRAASGRLTPSASKVSAGAAEAAVAAVPS